MHYSWNFGLRSDHFICSLLYVTLNPPRFPPTDRLRRYRRLGLDHEFQSRVALHLESCMDPSQGRLLVLPV